MDHLSKEHRSWNMSRIKSKNTKLEILVRSALHQMGYRFRLHGKVSKKFYPKGVLPGKPDIVLAKYRTVIFVHGCFWHRHPSTDSGTCSLASVPKTRTEWWNDKFEKNIERDSKNQKKLVYLGWTVIVIWECEIKKLELTEIQKLIMERLK